MDNETDLTNKLKFLFGLYKEYGENANLDVDKRFDIIINYVRNFNRHSYELSNLILHKPHSNGNIIYERALKINLDRLTEEFPTPNSKKDDINRLLLLEELLYEELNKFMGSLLISK